MYKNSEDVNLDKFKNLTISPSESFVEKSNPLKLYFRAQDSLPPIGGAVVGGTLGGLGGYYGSKALTNMVISLLFAGKSPEERAGMFNSLRGDERISRIGAILGALGGMYFSGGRDLDFGNWDSFKQSLWDKEYWKNKENLENRVGGLKNRIDDRWHTSKLASESVDRYTSDIIPISKSLDLVQNDLFLNPYQKNQTSSLIFGAEKKESGLTSGKDLTRSAINAGIGFVPAYGFGRIVGGVLGLPPPVRERVSLVGGLAAAVINSGVLQRK